MTKRILLVDGDVVSYRAAAANESRSIKVTHKLTGQTTEHAHRTAFKEHIRGSFEIDEFEIEDVRTPEDISHALHSIKTTIDSLMKTCNTTSVEVFLSGETNFRDSLPLPTKYKGAREDLERPIQLAECRQYIKRKYKCVIADNKEADDELTIRAYELRKQGDIGIVATIDKDALGTDIWLYNWTKMTAPIRIKGLGSLELDDKRVLRGIGRKWYYAQWLKGDVVDRFKPSEIAGKKFGDVSCYNLLNPLTTDKECLEAVYEQYLKWYPDPVTYTAWDGQEHTKDVFEIMDMYAACAHMMRWKGDILNSKQILSKAGIVSLTN